MKKRYVWLIWMVMGIFLLPQLRAQENNSAQPDVICEGDIKFYRVDPGENSGGGSTGSTYAWSVTAGPFAGTITPNQGPVVAWTAPLGSTNRVQIDWGASPPGNYTLQVIETSADGCQGTAVELQIQITPLETPTFAPIGPLCSGSTPPALPLSSIEGITGTWSPSTINTAAPGSFNYTFTPDAGQCANPATISVVITNTIVPTFTAITPVCVGAAAPTLPGTSVNGISGTWSPSTVNTATAGTTAYTFTPNPGQCASPVNLNVTINPATQNPLFVGLPTTLCIGASAPVLPSSSQQGFTGSWSPSNTVNTATSGTTIYTFTPDPGQCALPLSTSITVNPASQNPSFVGIPASLCQGTTPPALPAAPLQGFTGTWSPAVISTASVGSTNYTFTPDPGQCALPITFSINITAPNTSSFNAIPALCVGDPAPSLPASSLEGATGTWSPATINTAAAGNTVYTFTPDANQCAAAGSLSVTVNSSTVPSFDAVAPICSGGSLAALPTTSNNGITGSWSPALNNTATTTYTFTPNAGQCASTTTLTITVNAPQTPSFDPVAAICEGAPLATLPLTSNNGFSGTWSPAINNLATTTYTFTPSGGQCATTASLTITVNAPVTPTFTPIAAICSGASLAALPLTSTNGITGTWSPALNNTATTTYTFTPSAGQCASTASLTITVNPLPSISLNGSASCAPDLLTWSVNVTVSAGTLSTSAGTATNSGGNNWTVSGVPAGSNITLTVDDGSCSNTLSVNAPNCNCPPVAPPIGTGASYCAGSSPIPALTASVGGGITINWYDAPSGGNLLGSGTSFVPTAPGTYYAEAVDNLTNCVSSTRAAVTLTENPLPTVNASANVSICEGDNTTLNTSGASSYVWSPGSGLSSTVGATVTANPGSTITYTVTGTDGNGCQASNTVQVTVNPRPSTSPIFHD